ncbi:hypothetical protein EXIGLDRAFT_717809 [Exidia glandulosa HHB12029]|uniref:MutS protein homolog 3 n=1 Tax=Exidia glandulosa HHB12029 TaxID=1314781 RepID=A0A166AKK6_EXIGL|nr:hypothetical protein EXIGLDRAFT_717809 [Exidia glandulosa HHB12029]
MAPRQTTLAGFFESSSPPKPKTTTKPGARASAAIELDSDDDEPPKKRAKVSSSAPGPSKAKPKASGSTSASSSTTTSAAIYSPFFSPDKKAPSSKPVARTVADLSDDDDDPPPIKASKSKSSKASTATKSKKSSRSKDDPVLAFIKSGASATSSSKPSAGKGKSKASLDADDDVDDVGDGSDAEGMPIDIDELDSNKFKAFAHASKGKTTSDIGPSGLPYTPLEKQVMRMKDKYPGVLLLFEVGYKYRFYGDDARVAAQALGFVCYRMRNFLSASFPLQTRPQHVKKLLSLGHKVGVIGQSETAALKKAGTNRNSLFERKLLHIWTSATYIDDLESADNTDDMHQGSPPSILCLVERKTPADDGKVVISLVSVTPSTGDVVYDEFEDTQVRTELETRIAYLKPWELLLPAKGLSTLTEDMLKLVDTYSMRSQTRLERFKKVLDYTDAFDLLTKACKALDPSGDSNNPLISSILELPRQVVVAIAHVYQYLEQYGIAHVVLQAKAFRRFADRVHMLLNASTLANLEIFQNQTTFTKHGSLWEVLDKTETKFGSRMLKDWIGRPLTDRTRLQERLDAVEEIRTPTENGDLIDTLRTNILKRFSIKGPDGFPDLAKGLSKIQYGRCTPQELGRILSAFRRIANTFKSFDPEFGPGMRSKILNEILAALPSIQETVEKHTQYFDFEAAAKGKKEELWLGEEIYPEVTERNYAIMAVLTDLQGELKNIRKTLHRPALKYKEVTSNLVDEFVVEVEKSAVKDVPDDWELISKTTKYSRYRSPGAKALLFQLEQHREHLQNEADAAFRDFQARVAKDYAVLRMVVTQIATADCLVSLAHVSMMEDYCQPKFVDSNVLEIVEGRHPMLDLLRNDPYIPNSLELGRGHATSKVITGPNMGGKSSFVRMVGLIVIMAQIGSFVPAKAATLGLHDALLARMGASDELMKGRSTFMVEMAETNEIIKSATPNSLVILDELGRGTSTYDGMAIASAVLEHLVTTIRCKVLFITHYPHVATSLVEKYPFEISIAHMAFVEEETFTGVKTIHFLYKLREGLAGSFGVECGRLAGLPEEILETAAIRSAILQEQVQLRVAANKWRKAAAELSRLCSSSTTDRPPDLVALRAILQS